MPLIALVWLSPTYTDYSNTYLRPHTSPTSKWLSIRLIKHDHDAERCRHPINKGVMEVNLIGDPRGNRTIIVAVVVSPLVNHNPTVFDSKVFNPP